MTRSHWLAGAAMIAAAAACSKPAAAPPAASVSLALSKTSVAQGSVLDLTYRFQVAPDARISGDYRVFVHVNRDDGTNLWMDDHDLPPSLKTSTWKPGQVIEYSRTRFVPTFSYIGTATVRMGLYRDDERLPLSGPDEADRESPDRAYKVATIDIQPRSAQMYRLSGWHAPEWASDDPTVDWQWTQKVATLSLRNPKRDVTLFLEFDTRADLFPDRAQQVTVYAGEVALATFAAVANAPIQRIPVTTAQLGNGEMAEFRIEVDRTFVPATFPNAGKDQRELGIRVFRVSVESN